MRLTHCDRCKRVIPDAEEYRNIWISSGQTSRDIHLRVGPAEVAMDLCGGCYDDVLRVIEVGVVETPGRPEEP